MILTWVALLSVCAHASRMADCLDWLWSGWSEISPLVLNPLLGRESHQSQLMESGPLSVILR